MILFQNYMIVLDYDPGTDILSVVWPNVEAYQLPEVERALAVIAENIRHYDIKRLLIDASDTIPAPELDEVRHREIVTHFAQELTRTRLQKSARVLTADRVRDEKARKLLAEVVKATGLMVQSQDFLSREQALDRKSWLSAPESVSGKTDQVW